MSICTGCGEDHRICRGVHPELSTGTDWPVLLLYAALVLGAVAVVSALVARMAS